MTEAISPLLREFNRIQNVGLGSVCLWRFVRSYAEGTKTREGTPLLLCFLVLPLVFDRETCNLIHGTLMSTGLRPFAAKYSEAKNNKTDLLLDTQRRVRLYQDLSLDCLRYSIAQGLCALDYDAARVHMIDNTEKIDGFVGRDSSRIIKASEKLGRWFSPHSLDEISIILKVRF